MPDPSDIPILGAPRGPVLASPENPNGWRLEELLPVLSDELQAQTARFLADTRRPARDLLLNAYGIVDRLAQAEALQRDTVRCFEALGVGPSGFAGRDAAHP